VGPPHTGDTALDAKLRDAHTRFLSRTVRDREDALEKLWDAFERLKTLELGGQKKESIQQLIERATAGSSLRAYLEAECKALTDIGNSFQIRHFEHDKEALPAPAAVDCLFTRLLAVMAFLLRQTGRMGA